jgi:hypothetical protein
VAYIAALITNRGHATGKNFVDEAVIKIQSCGYLTVEAAE